MNNIKKIRKEQKMPQIEFARALGVTSSAVSQWENGLYNPKTSRLQDIADVLGCTVDDLLRKEVKQDVSTDN